MSEANANALQKRSVFQNALALHQRGELAEAERLYREVLKLDADDFDAVHLLGVIFVQRGQFIEGERLIAQALEIDRNEPNALNNRGIALAELKRFDEAVASFDKAIAHRPDYAEAFGGRGNALKALKRYDEAIASYDRAISLKPDYAEAFSNRGNALQELKRFDDALASYDKAIALKHGYAEAFSNRGVCLEKLKRFNDALASFDKAISLKSDLADAFANRGNTLCELDRFDEALASYDRAIGLAPGDAEAFNNRGALLERLKLFELALTSYEQALAIKPDHPYAFGALGGCVLKICDWRRAARLAPQIRARAVETKSVIEPNVLLGYGGDAALHLKNARSYIADKIPTSRQLLWNGTVWRHDKIRIAYLSADFRAHPVSYLIAELLELHDRARFDVMGVSFGPDDKSDMRSRLIKSFDTFEDVRYKSEYDVAKFLHGLQVDIAVDLVGHTMNSRLGILAIRPAPIQVNYLGYPGTMGADFIDYVIADKIVLPFGEQPQYTEKIVHLPECYQVNDSQRRIGSRTPSRQEVGLPESGFVFCCFNNNFKITPPFFDVWMRLLKAVDGSVLWLRRDNESAENNLRREANARGINAARLVFASRVPSMEDHLVRHRLADLFLDTLPYNAHTTASDALWAGLPVLTCCGNTFAGRVGASLLSAVGLPELVTHNVDDYEALALRLAQDSSLLTSLRTKLARNRESCPLFDSERFTRNLETAYATMWDIWQRGEKPQSFSVAPEEGSPISVR
jgi:protein O-GlcNAc transferase